MPPGIRIFTRKNGKAMKYPLDDPEPHCLECGDLLPYGRPDRKYCSVSCKNKHHNREARQWRSRYARTIGVLQKNHEILRNLIQIGIRSISKSELVQLGYQPDYVTSCCRVGKKTVCRCFDVVFWETENRLSGLDMEKAPWLPEKGDWEP